MDNLIKTLQQESLSGKDILKLINNKANLISYDELKNVKNIKDIMKHGACIILYLSEKHYGHWVCVFYRNKDLIEFFDPYGISIDLEKNWIPKEKQKSLGVEKNYLSKLLANSGSKIEFNHYHFQKKGDKNAVCGRWVAIRLIFRNISIDEFNKLFGFKKICIDSDWLVTLMSTNFVNN